MQAWLRRAGPAASEPAILEVLDVATLLGGLLAGSQPGVAPVELESEAAPNLAAVARAGLDAASVERIAAVLRAAGPLAPALQHGDLWPPNVIRSRDAWLLLDFELFGRLAAPMVDAMQLVRASGEILWPTADGTSWIAGLAMDADRPRFTRRLLDAARERIGLGRGAALGCSAFALLEITGRFLLAGRAEADWRPALRALQDFSALLAGGGPARAEAALFGGAA